jgi:hypothetical protein
MEVAGVVLGAIPILLASLKIGGEAVGSARRMLGHRAVISRYRGSLQAEAAIFKNTLIFLLEDLVSPPELQVLLERPDGEEWHDQSFILRLRDKRLGENYEAVSKIIELMNTTVAQLVEKIATPPSEKVSDCIAFGNVA